MGAADRGRAPRHAGSATPAPSSTCARAARCASAGPSTAPSAGGVVDVEPPPASPTAGPYCASRSTASPPRGNSTLVEFTLVRGGRRHAAARRRERLRALRRPDAAGRRRGQGNREGWAASSTTCASTPSASPSDRERRRRPGLRRAGRPHSLARARPARRARRGTATTLAGELPVSRVARVKHLGGPRPRRAGRRRPASAARVHYRVRPARPEEAARWMAGGSPRSGTGAWPPSTPPARNQDRPLPRPPGRSVGPMPDATDQRRAAVFALYQRDVTGRALADARRREARFTRALALRGAGLRRVPRREIARLSRGLDARPDRAAGARDHARRPARDAAPERPGDVPIPPEGAIAEAVRRRRVLRRRRARVRQRDPRPPRCARSARIRAHR